MRIGIILEQKKEKKKKIQELQSYEKFIVSKSPSKLLNIIIEVFTL